MRADALCSVSEAGKCTDDIYGVTLRHCINMLRPVTLLKVTELRVLSLFIIFKEELLCTYFYCIQCVLYRIRRLDFYR